jgi:UPF0755 protein
MKKIIIILISVILVCVIALFCTYNFMIKAPSKKSEEVIFNVAQGSSYSTIASSLKEKGLIKNDIVYKIYLKLNPVSEQLEYGDYKLNRNYDIEELLSVLKKGSITLANTVKITFKEGKNVRHFIKSLNDNLKITEEEVLNKLSDSNYLDSLIEKYWFLTDEIKNKDIYYSLEGYLYPDTYEFYTTASVEDVIAKMLDNYSKKVEPYKSKIEKSKYNVHEITTLASIIELEAGGADRKKVSGVFYNRIKKGMSLGSDVTGYYGAKMDDWTNGLGSHVNDCNGYNTRGTCVKALPVGPICNPSVKSIEAAIEPDSHKYYYFVADCKGKTYLSTNSQEHYNTIQRLQNEGNWCV